MFGKLAVNDQNFNECCLCRRYYYMGQYTVAPAFAGLQPLYKKIAFTMALPTIIGKICHYTLLSSLRRLYLINFFCRCPVLVIGVIYANITAKYLFNRILRNSPHRYR